MNFGLKYWYFEKKTQQISNEDWQKIENTNRYFDGKQWWVDPIWSPELLPQKQ